MCIVGAWFGGFVELCGLMDLGLRLNWEQLEETNAALCRSVEWLAGVMSEIALELDDGAPRTGDSSINDGPHT